MIIESLMMADGHYRVHVDGGNPLFLPPFGELNGDGRFDGASPLFDGNRAWKLHKSIRDVDSASGLRDFLLKECDELVWPEDVIDLMGRTGYQVCTPEERFAFAKAYPDLQRECPIVDPGSSTTLGGEARVAVLRTRSSGGERILVSGRFNDVWRSGRRILLRKQKLIPVPAA